MLKKTIKAVLFDWGKVVAIHDNRRAAQAFLPYSELVDTTVDIMEDLAFKEGRPLFDELMRGEISPADYRTLLRYELGLSERMTDEMFDRAFSDVFTLNEPMIPIIEGFRKEGLKLVAVSNMDAIRHTRLIMMGVHSMFDEHVLSYQVGMMKPNQDMYLYALTASGATCAEETLFVDDHSENTKAYAALGGNVYTYDYRNHCDFAWWLQTQLYCDD